MTPLDPDRATLAAWLDAASAWVLDHLDRLDQLPSWVDGRDVADAVGGPIPEHGMPFDQVLATFDRAALASFGTNTPGYLAYVPGGGLPATAIADLLADVANRFTGLATPAPALARLENDVLRWLCREVGYGEHARGLLTSGGSLANFTGVFTARENRLGTDLRGAVALTTAQAHHSVHKACRLAGVFDVRDVPTDNRLRMDPDALRAALRDTGAFLVVASAGTTNTGAVDPLPDVAQACAEAGAWLHVDGAYGGAWVLCDEGRRRLRGIELADSVSLDPHKGMFLPYGTGCLLARDGATLEAAHRGAASYLSEVLEGDSPARFGPELSRPYRGLRLWLPLMLHGAAAFREALAEKLELADRAWRGLADLGLEVLERPQLSTVAFRLPRGDDSIDAWNARNRELLRRIVEPRRVFLSGTTLDGVFTLRVCVVSFRTHADRIDAMLDDVRAALR